MKNTLAFAALALTLVLAGCGGSETTPNTTGDTDAASAQAEAGATDRGGPGGSGEVVDVTDSTAQVQNQQGQVAVSWTDATVFTQQVDADLSAVTVGTCVMVQSEDDTTSGDSVAAITVRITEATDDGCTLAGGVRPGGAGGERPDSTRTRPSDAPDRAAEGAPDGAGRGGGGGTVGEVTAVSADGFTVSAQQIGEEDASTVTVTVAAGTTFSATAEAGAADVTVGRCITSGGEADDTGAITATTIAITDPVDDACSTGFGGQRRQAGS